MVGMQLVSAEPAGLPKQVEYKPFLLVVFSTQGFSVVALATLELDL